MDLRKTVSLWPCTGIELSDENHFIFIPVGFAHPFASLEENSCLVYKTDAFMSQVLTTVFFGQASILIGLKNPDFRFETLVLRNFQFRKSFLKDQIIAIFYQ